ncbi:MAG: amino acid adenylation domain-containing protein [Beijerinckiaceae bacterium]|nr:amino acid adenylation domain-containing protein [Beijerinckiaceae bacterium]MCI0735397.1 amino acid adenylation domain-containing protein [Beijerinckiaceae bacterium]
MKRTLSRLLEDSTRRRPDHTAIEDADRDKSVSFAELTFLVDRVHLALAECGVRVGDRVGLCAPKSIGSVVSILGTLKAGAAYVPVDAAAPLERNASIFEECSVRAIIAARGCAAALAAALGTPDFKPLAQFNELKQYSCDLVLIEGKREAAAIQDAPSREDVAYILYTSGSTGKPKGVIHTHASALSFVDWCSGALAPKEEDRFSSHAPFHFDLSILDLYVPLKHGASVILFGEESGKTPPQLAAGIAGRHVTVWYSTPSVLRLLIEYGRLERYDWPALRLVLFAGEVFPVKYLRAIKAAWPHPRYFNLYGPTETNVCTYFEVPQEIPVGQHGPFPIGLTCENDRTKVMDEEGREVEPGREGELLVAGGSVMAGYWNLPDKTAGVFSADSEGVRWYKTGDLVRQEPDGSYTFLGRRDRMVKRRGYRVELGEIEAALYRHPAILEAAAIALADEDGGCLIKAVLSCPGSAAPSVVELKAYCSRNLPLYMVPDRFHIQASLPKTSTDKIDYQLLKALG